MTQAFTFRVPIVLLLCLNMVNFCASQAILEPAITFSGTTSMTLPENFPPIEGIKFKQLQLLKIKFSEQAKEKISERIRLNLNKKNALRHQTINLPKKIDLGINGVPVFHQGKFGSCVAYSVTAGLDAALGKGDYVSQLCALALGNYLSDRGYLNSGWEGSTAKEELEKLSLFGIIHGNRSSKNEHELKIEAVLFIYGSKSLYCH